MDTTNLDHTLLALADRTRRSILQRLSRGEARVTELAKPFEMSLNGVSKHIRILERAHLVERRRSGRDHFLSLNPAPLNQAAEWLEKQRSEWTARLSALDQMLQEEDRIARSKKKNSGGKK
jgi:DNA-binding transcriptional ArsR family regulator